MIVNFCLPQPNNGRCSMSINNLLFSVQNMSPAMLSVGAGKTQNYNNLSELSSSLWGTNSTNNSSNSSSLNSATDTVSLAYKNVGSKMVTDMAAVTADAIKQFPDLDKDYVIAIIDDGTTREARVYRRSEILENYGGTDEEKAALLKQLEANPLMVFNNANGLPPSSSDKASQYLSTELNSFLKTNSKTFDSLDKAGYDPLADFLSNSTMKKILASCANPVFDSVKDKETEETKKEEDSSSPSDDSSDDGDESDA